MKISKEYNPEFEEFLIYNINEDNSLIKQDGLYFIKDVIFQHKRSGKYLSVINLDDQNILQLVSHLNDDCKFQLRPVYESSKYHQTQVINKDEFNIQFRELFIVNDAKNNEFQSDLQLLPNESSIFQIHRVDKQCMNPLPYQFNDIVVIRYVESENYLYNDSQIWQFYNSLKFDEHIDQDDTFYLKCYKSGLYLGVLGLVEEQKQGLLLQLKNNKGFYILTEFNSQQSVQYRNCKISLQQSSSEDYIQIKQMGNANLYVDSLIKIIKLGINLNQNLNDNERILLLMSQIEFAMKDIILNIGQQDEYFMTKESIQFLSHDSKLQDIFRERGIIQLIFELRHTILNYEQLSSVIEELDKWIYLALEMIVAQNKDNALLILKLDEDIPSSFYFRLFDTNHSLIKNVDQYANIKQLIEQQWSFDTLELMCLLAQDNPILVGNNAKLLDMQFQNQQLMVAGVDVNEIFLYYKNYDPEQQEKMQNDLHYLFKQLDLIHILTQQYENIRKFKKIFPQEQLFQQIMKQVNNLEFRCKLIAIYINLYIEQGIEQSLQEILYDIVFKSILYQDRINLQEEVVQVLEMYYKMYLQNKQDKFMQLCLLIFTKAYDSMDQSIVKLEQQIEYQHQYFNRSIFNRIISIIIQVLHNIQRKSQKKSKQSAQQSNVALILENAKKLLNHVHINTKTKLNLLQLIFNLGQPLRMSLNIDDHNEILEHYKIRLQNALKMETIECPFLEDILKIFEIQQYSIQRSFRLLQMDHLVFQLLSVPNVDLVRNCFKILYLFAFDNILNQERLIQSMPILIKFLMRSDDFGQFKLFEILILQCSFDQDLVDALLLTQQGQLLLNQWITNRPQRKLIEYMAQHIQQLFPLESIQSYQLINSFLSNSPKSCILSLTNNPISKLHYQYQDCQAIQFRIQCLKLLCHYISHQEGVIKLPDFQDFINFLLKQDYKGFNTIIIDYDTFLMVLLDFILLTIEKIQMSIDTKLKRISRTSLVPETQKHNHHNNNIDIDLQEIRQFAIELAEYLSNVISKNTMEINVNQLKSILERMFSLCQKKIQIKSQVNMRMSSVKQIDQYSTPKFIQDKRLYELYQISNLKIYKLINQSQDLKQERFDLIKYFSIDCIPSLLECLRISNYEMSMDILQLIQHILDIFPLNLDSGNSARLYEQLRNGKSIPKAQEFMYFKNTKLLQNLIVNNGYFETFIDFVNNQKQNKYQFKQLLYQFILTSIKLLQGYDSVNEHTQQTFFNCISKDNKMIHLFNKILTSKKRDQKIVMRNQLQESIDRIQLSFEYSETHFFDSGNLKQGILNALLQLIQLLVENHFAPFQNYFRVQDNSLKSVNLLESIMNLIFLQFPWESFCPISADEYVTQINCFNCLKELIQGPCEQNQAFLCNTQFLKLCSKLLNYDDTQEKFLEMYGSLKDEKVRVRQITINESQKLSAIQELKLLQTTIIKYYGDSQYAQLLEKSFFLNNPGNFRLHMLSQLKFRCAATLDSLIDGGGNANLMKIINHISDQQIIRNLSSIYVKFKILHGSGKNYTQEVFKVENSQLAEEVNVELAVKDFRQSLLIETGFCLFSILCHIYQHKQLDTVERIQQQIAKTQKSKKKRQKSLFLALFSLFAQTTDASGEILKMQTSGRVFTRYHLSKSIQKESLITKKLGYRALRFFATRTGSIEVFDGHDVRKVLFPLLPQTFLNNHQIRDKFLSQIDLLSIQSKVHSILMNGENVIQKLSAEYDFYSLYKNHFLIKLLVHNQSLWKQVIFIIIVVENIFVLYSTERTIGSLYDQIAIILNYVQLSLQSLCFFIFLVKKFPYLRVKANEEILKRQIKRIKQKQIKYQYSEHDEPQFEAEQLLLQQVDELLKGQNKFVRLYNYLSDKMVLIIYLFFDYEILYFIFFTIIGIAGIFNKMLLSLLLLDIFWRFPMLSKVANAIWQPRRAIILVMTLFMIFQYYYAIVIYQFLQTEYYPLCQDLLQCFSLVVDMSLKVNGGIVGDLLQIYQNNNYFVGPEYKLDGRSLIEFSYVFFVLTLLYSIITGIVIDDFGIQRDGEEKIDGEINGFCLICGIGKGHIEKKAKHKKGFMFHIQYEHCIWNYIFYMMYLIKKQKSDYNGMESYINREIESESIKWFPIGRCLSIENEDEWNVLSNQLELRINMIEQDIKKVI